MPVHLLTILAMSSSSTSSLSMRATPALPPAGVELFQFGVHLGQFAVLNLRSAIELAFAGLLFGFEAQRLDLLFQFADAGDGFAFFGPAGAQSSGLFSEGRKFALDFFETAKAVLVGFALEGGAFDFERGGLALQLIDFGRHGADLDGQRRRSFVDQVDGLVGQEAVADVAVRERRGRDDRRILDAHVVVRFVALFEAAQDGDGVFDVGLADVDDLEAAFERCILFDVLAVLVQRGCADGTQFAAGKRRLEHVAGVDGAFGCAGTDEGVQLVDEEDDLAVGLFDLFEHGFEPVFELAADTLRRQAWSRDRAR